MLVVQPLDLVCIGEPHRRQRKLLNPVFSINHMRHMLPIFYEVTDRVRPPVSVSGERLDPLMRHR